MLIRVGRDGTLLATETFLGEEDYKLSVVLQKSGYYLFVEGEKIVGIIANACGSCKTFLMPQVAVDNFGARLIFCNVNGRPILSEFFALVVVRAPEEAHQLPSIEEVYRKFAALSGPPHGGVASGAQKLAVPLAAAGGAGCTTANPNGSSTAAAGPVVTPSAAPPVTAVKIASEDITEAEKTRLGLF
jgi:hypothetical protein